ncbi:EcsC family protein [Chitinophaga sp.]|uniref:EcsC family protein n=1 Tax=Chitinophaga sp. TaxID=1869181 RepID=UPI002B517604|nr:EcsC family protein [Chitinophaga sp.]HWV64756.1 EcsC family protein [Chitinophaga sp.]
MLYEQRMSVELELWQHKMRARPSMFDRVSKSVQSRVNRIIPQKVHDAVTVTIKQMVRGVLFGATYTAPAKPVFASMYDMEEAVLRRVDVYRKTAAAEGGITGAGGILLGLADFPILLGMKLKLLFDIAAFYGFDVKDYKERLYILYIFQLAFSSQEYRRNVFEQMVDWKEKSSQLPEDIHSFDWQQFQIEYRDHIDLAKMGQLLPVVGAAVGVVVNYRLITRLGNTAMNAYRMRILE